MGQQGRQEAGHKVSLNILIPVEVRRSIKAEAGRRGVSVVGYVVGLHRAEVIRSAPGAAGFEASAGPGRPPTSPNPVHDRPPEPAGQSLIAWVSQ